MNYALLCRKINFLSVFGSLIKKISSSLFKATFLNGMTTVVWSPFFWLCALRLTVLHSDRTFRHLRPWEVWKPNASSYIFESAPVWKMRKSFSNSSRTLEIQTAEMKSLLWKSIVNCIQLFRISRYALNRGRNIREMDRWDFFPKISSRKLIQFLKLPKSRLHNRSTKFRKANITAYAISLSVASS